MGPSRRERQMLVARKFQVALTRAMQGVYVMAKNRAKDVSLVTFAEKYFQVLKAGGTIDDLMNACEMENKGSTRQKLVKLKEQYRENGHGELPSLKHSGRSPNKGETVGQTASNRLAALFAASNNTSNETSNEGDSDESDTNTEGSVSATTGNGNVELTKVIHDMAAKAADFTEVATKAEKLVEQVTGQSA